MPKQRTPVSVDDVARGLRAKIAPLLDEVKEVERVGGSSFHAMVASKPSMRRFYEEIAGLSGVIAHPHPKVLDIGGGGGVLGEAIASARASRRKGGFDYIILDNSETELSFAKRLAGTPGLTVDCVLGDRADPPKCLDADYAFTVFPTKNVEVQKALHEQVRCLDALLERGEVSAAVMTMPILFDLKHILDGERDLLFFNALKAVKEGGVSVWAEATIKDMWVSDLSRLGPQFGFRKSAVEVVRLGDVNRRLFAEYYPLEDEMVDPTVFVVVKKDSVRVDAEHTMNVGREVERWLKLSLDKQARDVSLQAPSQENRLLEDLLRKKERWFKDVGLL